MPFIKKSKLFISEPDQKEFRPWVKTTTDNLFVVPMNSSKNRKPAEKVISDFNKSIRKHPHPLIDVENLKAGLMKCLKNSYRNYLTNKISIASFEEFPYSEYTIRNIERQDAAVVLMI